jgi:GAF domain-containing protein
MEKRDSFRFKTQFSLEPLLAFWKNKLAAECEFMAEMNRSVLSGLDKLSPAAKARTDAEKLRQHLDLLRPLLTAIFDPASWNTELKAILEPFKLNPLYATPRFERLLLDETGSFKGGGEPIRRQFARGRMLRAYLHILERLYGIRQDFNVAGVREVSDQKTGLSRFYRFEPDLTFVDVAYSKSPVKLDKIHRSKILDDWNNLDLLLKILPPEKFLLKGFTILNAVDCTEAEILSRMERMLVERQAALTGPVFYKLREHMRILFKRSHLEMGVAGLREDDVMLLNPREELEQKQDLQNACLFKNSMHIPQCTFEGSIYSKAIEQNRTMRENDIMAQEHLTPTDKHLIERGIRSIMVSPLLSEGEPIGCVELYSKNPNEFGPLDAILLERVAPVMSMAVKMALDKINHEVQAIVKERATAVHKAVEWRFTRAAQAHLDRLYLGQPSEMEPIVFKDVQPLYGDSDIRGSSVARNTAIQEDLSNHLTLANQIILNAAQVKDWPLLQEMAHGVQKHLDRLSAGLSTGDEVTVTEFIHREIEPVFGNLKNLGPKVTMALAEYDKAIDQDKRTVYKKRRQFEEAVSTLNREISGYLDQEEALAQGFFPHYFEKHQTDGVDYVIYIGESMAEHGGYSEFFARNLRLWQLMTACGIAWLTEKMKPSLDVELDTCHLILVNHNPLSVRFRYDEKRFDVDGAYDVRQEIIKSRIDKAVLKKTGERLTQPGQVAMVYSTPAEGREMRRHISFLQARGFLMNDRESLDLEELPGVKGLKALRVGVNLKSSAMEQRLDRLAVG